MARKRRRDNLNPNQGSRSKDFEIRPIDSQPARKNWSPIPRRRDEPASSASCGSDFAEGDKDRRRADGGDNRQGESLRGRKPGQNYIYSPQQTERYKSQYMRYARALDITPSSVVTLEDGTILHKFKSCDSPTGFWTVTQTPGEVSAGIDITELCSETITLMGEADDPATWSQISGSTVVLADVNSLITTFNRAGTSGPYVFRLSLDENPSIFDEVTVYTTPTSIYNGITIDSSQRPEAVNIPPCAIVPCEFFVAAPEVDGEVVEELAYEVTPDRAIRFYWGISSCLQSYLSHYEIQKNTGAGWIEEEIIDPTDLRAATVNQQDWYRINANYFIHEVQRLTAPGCANQFNYSYDGLDENGIPFEPEEEGDPIGTRRVFAHDTFNGTTLAKISSSFTGDPLNSVRRTGTDEFNGQTIGRTSLRGEPLEQFGRIARIGIDELNGFTIGGAQLVEITDTILT